MSVTVDKYDQSKIDTLRYFLEKMKEQGAARPYEIFVDGLKVIPKTEDTSQFDAYQEYIDQNTKLIRLKIYDTAHSPRNNQYCFEMQGIKSKAPDSALGEIDSIVQDKLAARDKEYEITNLRKELAEARQEIAEADAEIESLRQELEDFQSGKIKKQIKGVEILSVILEGFVRRNPQLLQRIPGGEALAGLIETDNMDKIRQFSPEPVAAASFAPKATNTTDLSSDQLRYIDTLRQLEQTFQQPDLERIMQILGQFAESPETLNTVSDLLNLKNNIV